MMRMPAGWTLRVVAWVAGVAAFGGLPGPVRAGLANPPHQDVHWLAEHVPESAQDARAFAIPWPGDASTPGGWHGFVGLGAEDTRADFVRERGGMLSFGADRLVTAHSGVLLFGFYDRFTIGGGSGVDILSPRFFPGVPLDLPEPATFSRPRGRVTHAGAGFAWTHTLGEASSPSPTPWRFEIGAYGSRLELQGYRFDFTLLGGANAGARGVLDQSGTATFVTPFVGLERRIGLGGSSWVLRPRVMLGAPLPTARFDARITGSGFTASSRDAGGRPGRIGDGFVTLGMGLLESGSGFEIDLGSALVYPLFERASHKGLDRSLMINALWHF